MATRKKINVTIFSGQKVITNNNSKAGVVLFNQLFFGLHIQAETWKNKNTTIKCAVTTYMYYTVTAETMIYICGLIWKYFSADTSHSTQHRKLPDCKQIYSDIFSDRLQATLPDHKLKWRNCSVPALGIDGSVQSTALWPGYPQLKHEIVLRIMFLKGPGNV